VLRLRFGLDDLNPRTLPEINESLGLTRVHVRRIASDTLNKFNKLRASIAASNPPEFAGRIAVKIDWGTTAVYGGIMDYRHLITIEPDKRSGQPCIRGLRMTVQDVLEYLASGMSAEEVLADFPDLTADDIRACLAFAADLERRLRVVPPA
jgi:uncharacterized protein (DUF433 family)